MGRRILRKEEMLKFVQGRDPKYCLDLGSQRIKQIHSLTHIHTELYIHYYLNALTQNE